MTAIAAASPARVSRAILIAAFTQLVVVLDGAVLTIALPSLASDLHVAVASLPWVANAYALPLAGSLLLGGRIADLFGAVPCLRVGLVLLAIASLGAGLAPTFEWLLFFRVAQALGAALLSPASLALLTDSTSPGHERERGIAIWSVTAVIGGAVGALVGGALTQVFDWRWTMLINVALAPAIVLLTRGIGRRREPSGERVRHQHFDVPGTLLFILGIGGLTLAVTLSVPSSVRWIAAVIAIAALAAFGLVESRSIHPLLPLRLLLTARVGLTNAAAFLMMAGLAVTGFYTSLYAQVVSGLSPLTTALLLLPSAIAAAVASRLVPRLIARFGERSLRTAASLTAAGALAALAGLTLLHPPFALMVPILVVQSAGASVGVIVLTSASTRSLPLHQAGLAGGLITTAGQVGSSVGLALLTGVAAAVVGGAQSGLASVDPAALAGQMAVAIALGAVVTALSAIAARAIPLAPAPA